ncbi:hypothetical protein [uncultured Methanospirillum sp.]|uniref:hypothetical protein n=1 Tax=uncultured Methanospirillum sp. TaxID=262503 RepID=UPI0029C949C9|nr:hypothetical protein [uncultured Methanospirillum sp.]
MNRRYLFLIAVISTIILLLIVGPAAAKTVWSICDESANPGCADDAKSKGYWNFAYDDAAPFVTAGLYCCWWERWYKWNKFSQWKDANTMNLGSSDNSLNGVQTKSYTPGTVGSSEVKASPTLTQIQPEDGYCPSCCSICDDQTAMELQAKSDAIMAKKPWLTEGKNKGTTSASATTTGGSVKASPTVAQMSFSEAV